VAALDATERGHVGLGDYYSQRGESPSVWARGCRRTAGRGAADEVAVRAGPPSGCSAPGAREPRRRPHLTTTCGPSDRLASTSVPASGSYVGPCPSGASRTSSSATYNPAISWHWITALPGRSVFAGHPAGCPPLRSPELIAAPPETGGGNRGTTGATPARRLAAEFRDGCAANLPAQGRPVAQ
jgi:hypothetical protein